MRTIARVAAGTAAVAALCGVAQAQEAAALPEWMVGAWCTAPGSERTCDKWFQAANELAGTSQAAKDGKTTETETMRIATVNGRLTFFASVNGAPEVPFVATVRGAQAVTFENPAHDYPQRIRFWREGERFRAEIAQSDGSQAVSWDYAPEGP